MEYGFSEPTRKLRLALFPTLLWLTWSSGNASAACELQLLNTVPMQISDNIMTLQADLNGKARSLQFGTAAIASQMTEASASEIGLTPHNVGSSRALSGSIGAAMSNSNAVPVGSPMQNSGILGSASFGDPSAMDIYDSKGVDYAGVVTVSDFSMQAMVAKNIDFIITPFPPPGTDGVLNIELFRHFDIDLNFAARSFNLFSQDHCEGQILYWRAPGVAALPFLTRDNRIVAHVMLEGKELTAVIDTGSPFSVLRFETASRLFGVTLTAAGVTLAGEHHANDRQDLYAYTFRTLSFGTVAIGNPHLMLTQSQTLVRGEDPNARTGSRVLNDAAENQPDMIIGMDLLKLTHLYIALGERVLYVTQGTELAPDTAGAQPIVSVVPFRP